MNRETTIQPHYLLEGPEDAPVLVLSNSLGTTLEMWEDQAASLHEHYRLLRYDHRGHGGSAVPPGPYAIEDLGRDILTLLDGLEIERFSFCGISIGGMVGMWLASEIPERIDRLVLCSTSAKLGSPDNWSQRAATVRENGIGAIADSVMELWFTPDFRSSRPETVGWATRMLQDTPVEGYAGCCEAIRDMDLRDRLDAIIAPTLVLAGADDPAITFDHVELIRDLIPNAHAEIIREASHVVNIEKPEEITQRILGNLDTLRKEKPLSDSMHDRGMKVRREVLGDDYVDTSVANTTDFTADFQDFITRCAWGEIWTRPGLDRKTRSCITLTALMAGGHLEELGMHVEAALRNGLTEEEVKEVLLQGAIYCGVPTANSAFAVAQRVLTELDSGTPET